MQWANSLVSKVSIDGVVSLTRTKNSGVIACWKTLIDSCFASIAEDVHNPLN